MHASVYVCRILSTIGFCLTATLVQAAGLRSIDIPADADGPSIHGVVWYPCAEPPGEVRVDPFILPGVKDCPLAGESYEGFWVTRRDQAAWFSGTSRTSMPSLNLTPATIFGK